MPTLQTALSLNSAELESEFAKAAATVKRFAADVENSANRSLQRARGEVEALRLEAAGHKDAADALRQKMLIEEQAVVLAKATGLSQQNAIQLTQRRIQLEQQLAATQSRTAGSGGARPGRIGLPELPLTTAKMNRAFVATDKVNKQLRALEGSGKAGAFGFLAVSQAIEDAQYGIRGVLNNIPQAIIGFGFGAGLAGALSIAAVAAVSLYKPLRRVYGLLDKEEAEKAAKTWADAAAKAAEAIRNLQSAADEEKALDRYSYEINTTLRERIDLQSIVLKYYQDQGKAQEMEFEFAKRLLQARRSLAEAQGAPLPTESPRQTVEELEKQLANRRKVLSAAQSDELDLTSRLSNIQQDAADRQQSAAAKLLELKKELAGVDGDLGASQEVLNKALKNARNLWDEIVTFAGTGDKGVRFEEYIEAQKLATLRENLAIQEKLKAGIQQQISTLEKQTRVESEAGSAATSAAQAKLDALRQTSQASFDEISTLEKRIQLEQELAKISAQIRKAEEEKIRKNTEASQKNLEQQMDILRATLAGDQDKLDSIDRQRRIEEEILRLKKEQLGITEAEARKQAESKADAQDAIRDKERADKAREKAGNQRATFLQLQQELQVLRLRASGRSKEAQALEDEFKARAEAVRLAREANIPEAEALKLIRERQRLEKEIAKGKEPERRRGTIYKKDGPGGGNIGRDGVAGQRRIGFDGNFSRRIGLGGSAVETARNSRPRDPEAAARSAAMNYYQKTLQQNEELLNIWRTIGVA